MTAMDVRPTTGREIEDAKIVLDGARSIYAHNPTAENARVVTGCEDTLNYLLDCYPRSEATRSAPVPERN